MRIVTSLIAAAAMLVLTAPAQAARPSRAALRAAGKIERTVKRAYPGTTEGRPVYANCRGRGSKWNCSYEIWNGFDDCYQAGVEGRRCPLVRYTGYGRIRRSHIFISRPRR